MQPTGETSDIGLRHYLVTFLAFDSLPVLTIILYRSGGDKVTPPSEGEVKIIIRQIEKRCKRQYGKAVGLHHTSP